MSTRSQSIQGLSQRTNDRFYEVKGRAQERMGLAELTNEEFMQLLLERYELED